MIALVRGEVAVRRADHVVVACGGVGYRLAVSAETLRHVPARRASRRRCTRHLIVRDDALLLYGFATEEERDLFLLLIGVQRVGPKVALAVLSGGPPRELLGARSPPATPRASRPCPGIGKRTAERIVVELREKVGAAPADDPIVDRARRRPARARARRPASASASRPQEADELLDGAAGRDARGPDRPRAARRRADEPTIRTAGGASTASRRPHARPEDELDARCARGGSTSSSARRR